MKFVLRLPFLARDTTLPTMEEQMSGLLTSYRASHGLLALQVNNTLNSVAKRRSELALDYYLAHNVLTHDDPSVTGDRYFELLPAYGVFTWDWAGENLALNNSPDPIPVAMDGLKNSTTHNENMLSSNWTDVGFGITARSGFTCIAQIFLDRSGP